MSMVSPRTQSGRSPRASLHRIAVPQNQKQEAVPQPVTGVKDRLDLGSRHEPGMLPGCLQLDRAAPFGLAPAEMVEERPPPRASLPDGLEFGDQVAQADAVPGMKDTKAADRREFPVDRARPAMVAG